MTERRYRIGAIGCGKMGMGHVKAIAADPRWEFVWACDISDARRAEVEALAPGAKWTADAEDLYNDDSLDAISVNTLSDIRPGMIRKALAAGKHVLCEKPLAPKADEARALLDDIKASDRLVTTNLFNRNAYYLRRAWEFVQAGEIGEVAMVSARHTTPGTPGWRYTTGHQTIEGHVLHDCGMHYVDVLRWFGGADITDFTARAVRLWESEFEVQFMVQGTYANGALFDLHNGFGYTALAKDTRWDHAFDITGTHGGITIYHQGDGMRVLLNGHRTTEDFTTKYGGKNLDVHYADFAKALDTGDLGLLPRPEDAVIASETAQRMVDQALAQPIANFGRASDLPPAPVNP